MGTIRKDQTLVVPSRVKSNIEEITRHRQDNTEGGDPYPPQTTTLLMFVNLYLDHYGDDFETVDDGDKSLPQYRYVSGPDATDDETDGTEGDETDETEDHVDTDDDKLTFSLSDGPSDD